MSLKGLIDSYINWLTHSHELKKAKEYVLKRGSATLLLISTDWGHYGGLKNQLQQGMAMGMNNYPKFVDETMKTLNTFAKLSKCNGNQRKGTIKQDNTEVAFTQKECKKIICYHCGEENHDARVCPKKGKGKEETQVHTQLEATSNESGKEEEEVGFVYHQSTRGLVWKICLFMNSKSNINIFNNKNYLKEVHKAKKPLKLQCY